MPAIDTSNGRFARRAGLVLIACALALSACKKGDGDAMAKDKEGEKGPDAIPVARKLIGKTNGLEAEPGTIRGDFSASKQNNLIHGSDSPESAAREIALWFTPEEVAAYSIPGDGWISEEF